MDLEQVRSRRRLRRQKLQASHSTLKGSAGLVIAAAVGVAGYYLMAGRGCGHAPKVESAAATPAVPARLVRVVISETAVYLDEEIVVALTHGKLAADVIDSEGRVRPLLDHLGALAEQHGPGRLRAELVPHKTTRFEVVQAVTRTLVSAGL